MEPIAQTKTVTRRDGELRVQDGPFAETRESLAGVFVIDVPDEDARTDRIIGTLRDFWTALAAGDAEQARRIVEADARHWTSDLVPYFEERARPG